MAYSNTYTFADILKSVYNIIGAILNTMITQAPDFVPLMVMVPIVGLLLVLVAQVFGIIDLRKFMPKPRA